MTTPTLDPSGCSIPCGRMSRSGEQHGITLRAPPPGPADHPSFFCPAAGVPRGTVHLQKSEQTVTSDELHSRRR